MTRKNFTLTSPYREITSADETKQFTNELFPQGNVLADLATMNIGHRHVFVYEQNNEILAFLIFDDHNTYFHIEFVAVNRLIPSGLSAGTKLILLLEELGRNLKYDNIELYSLEQKISYYEALGFDDTRITEIGNYGKMSKMVKSLTSW